MAIPKKGSRSIVVDEVPYRWRATKTGKTNLFVSVQPVTEGESSLLSVNTSVSVPNGCMCPGCGDIYVTPAVVEAYIRRALEQGWEPNKKGTPFVLVADPAMATGKT